MISCTLNHYKNNYNSILSIYLNEFEDNTEIFFLQNENKKYQQYQNSLSKIEKELNLTNSKNNQVYKSIASDLKNICPDAYHKIITELNNKSDNISIDENIFSLSKLKNDKVIVDVTVLENHLKSSIIILKFISNKILNTNLLKDHLSIDNLEEKSNSKEIIKTFPLTAFNLIKLGVKSDIIKNNFNDWLDNKGIKIDYNNGLIYTGFDVYRKKLLSLKNLSTNNLKKNGLTDEEIFNIELEVKKEFEDKLSSINDDFKLEFLYKSMKLLSGEIEDLSNEIIKETYSNFLDNEDNNLDNQKTTDVSISLENNPIDSNPYPRIFTSSKAYELFSNLKNEFGDTKENLANYSFVFHKMKKDKLIFDNLKQLEFINLLLSYDINIDRIKTLNQLGKTDLRESIYNRVK
jgi:hypothetical protein